MFSLFKRPVATRQELTFKARVRSFWEWYSEVAPRFYQTIEDKKCPSLAAEVSAKIDELLPGFAWVFGPGANGNGHSFTLSGEGVLHRQLLALFWHSQAPNLSGWTFYTARQPGSIKSQRIEIGGKSFDPIEFWLTPCANREREKVDLNVWHPLFSSMTEQDRWAVLFLFLDEVLGELGTQQWIGEIKLNDQQFANAIPLEELRPFLIKLESETGWKKYPPGELGVVYKLKEQDQRFLRSDTIAGSTTDEPLIQEYLAAKGELLDPLLGTGADYVFVSFDANFLPPGKQTETRGVIEDALAKALKLDSNGQSLGGALGTQNAYIDLLLFDGANSLETVRRVLAAQNLPVGTAINYFAKEKRGFRIVL
jgi:hypothetical protein